MDYKKTKAGNFAITRNLRKFDTDTDNIYESVVVIAKRSNQIASDIKEELSQKIQEFATTTDTATAEETFENKEQIELARYYEQIPKPTLIATEEFLNDEIYYRKPDKN